MHFIVESMGAKRVAMRFTRMGEAAINTEPAMTSVGMLIMDIFDKIFESEGRRGGGSWKADTAAWLLRKQRQGLDQRVGHATLRLRSSLSIPGAPHQIFEVSASKVEVGSDLPYAATEQEHRPFVKFTERDRVAMRNVIRDWLVTAWRTA